VATLLALAWQAALVSRLYGGDWSSLYDQGDQRPLPAMFRGSYVFHHSAGFDGQYYRVVAHDPLARGDLRSVDAPVLRYRRILVPGLAFALGFGSHPWIDRAFDWVILASLFAGAYWMALLASALGYATAWGLGFLLIPGVFSGVERATVDSALISLTLGFVWYAWSRQDRALWLVVACAPLARETGLCLTAGLVLWEMIEWQWRRAVVFGSAVAPAAAWFLYVAGKFPPDPLHRFSWLPMEELWISKFRYNTQQISGASQIPGAEAIQVGLYYVALAAAVMAWYLALRHLRTHLESPQGIAVVLFTLVTLLTFAPGLWFSAYNFTRVFAPLVLLLAWEGMTRRRWAMIVPLLAMIPAPLLVPAAKALQIAKGLIRADG
jgi:hypothetical protein